MTRRWFLSVLGLGSATSAVAAPAPRKSIEDDFRAYMLERYGFDAAVPTITIVARDAWYTARGLLVPNLVS
jgi:hypothetical protein